MSTRYSFSLECSIHGKLCISQFDKYFAFPLSVTMPGIEQSFNDLSLL